MKPRHFWRVIAELEDKTEGDDFAINISLLGGAELREYTVVASKYAVETEAAPLVELSKEDKPPIYVDIEHIATVELANRGGF
jgi:hypothetical protein